MSRERCRRRRSDCEDLILWGEERLHQMEHGGLGERLSQRDVRGELPRARDGVEGAERRVHEVADVHHVARGARIASVERALWKHGGARFRHGGVGTAHDEVRAGKGEIVAHRLGDERREGIGCCVRLAIDAALNYSMIGIIQ